MVCTLQCDLIVAHLQMEVEQVSIYFDIGSGTFWHEKGLIGHSIFMKSRNGSAAENGKHIKRCPNALQKVEGETCQQ